MLVVYLGVVYDMSYSFKSCFVGSVSNAATIERCTFPKHEQEKKKNRVKV